jgi:hypothetical protein
MRVPVSSIPRWTDIFASLIYLNSLVPWRGFDLRDRPVFVLAQHRSGGTLLARLLNCHERLVIWGEHAGFIDDLANAHAKLQRWSQQLPERSIFEVLRYVSKTRLADVEFRPWMSPFSPADFSKHSRKTMHSLFTRGLRPDQRWGFKEIRYHRPEIISFLHELFPQGQFVVLERNVTDLCVSGLMVPWTLQELLSAGIEQDKCAVLQRVEDELYSILGMRRNWSEALAHPDLLSIVIRYEDIVSDMPTQMETIFQFLGLSLDNNVRARMHIVIGAVSGLPEGTISPSGDRGYLTPEFVREAAEQLLPKVAKQIEQDGVDQNTLRP